MKTSFYLLVGFFILAMIGLTAFSFQRQTQPMTTVNDYTKEWKEIEAFAEKRLFKSALEATEKLFLRAKSENNGPQIIKTLLYSSNYRNLVEEDTWASSIDRFIKEADEAQSPVKEVLQSVIGHHIENYLSLESWRIKDRTSVADLDPLDIESMSIRQLLKLSSDYYWSSVQNEDLKSVDYEAYKAILNDNTNSPNLRTNLYDLLVHQAIDFYMDDRSSLGQPDDPVLFDNPDAFGPAAAFVQLTWPESWQKFPKYKAVILMQKLLQDHLADKTAAERVDIDLKRLKLVYDNNVIADKDSLYYAALTNLKDQLEGDPAQAEVLYKMAKYHYDKGWLYNTTAVNDHLTEEYKLAKALCEEAIDKHPKSFAISNCKQLINNITNKSLSLELEEVVLPNEPILAAISYQNLDQVHLRLMALTEEEYLDLKQGNWNDQLKKAKQLTLVEAWDQKLPNPGDHYNHRVEIKVPGQENGRYALLISDRNDFNPDKGAVGFLFFQTSTLGFVNRSWGRGSKSQSELLIVDRKTGAPQEGVTAIFYQESYNRNSNIVNRKEVARRQSDQNGFVKIDFGSGQFYQVELQTKNQQLYDISGLYTSRSNYDPKPVQHTHLFLDRAIYRPGQTIFFKGLAIEKDPSGKAKILTNTSVKLQLLDINRQQVEELKLTTNEYGTFTGTFTAPQGRLLGNMSIYSSIGNNEKRFQVEEYKRPTFEVTFDPLEQSYELGDEVLVSGQSADYAGGAVGNTQVKYRVVRKTQFPWEPWWLWRPNYFPGRSTEVEISRGMVQTDAEGKFEISFPAIPDKNIDSKRNPAFHFDLFAEVTDITGETQSGNKTVVLSNLGLQLKLEMEKELDRTQPAKINLAATNLDDQPQTINGKLEIVELDAPDTYFIERYWDKPDQFIIGAADFKKDFPQYAYKEENIPANWAVQRTVHQQELKEISEKELALEISDWPVGHYRALFTTKDAKGNEIEQRQYFMVYDANTGAVPTNVLFKKGLDQAQYEPGTTAQIQLATAKKRQPVLVEVMRNEDRILMNWESLEKWQTIDQAISEADRGNLVVGIHYARYNRFFAETLVVPVPWTNKDLQVEYQTFRDHLEPGQKEEWRLKISGPKKEKVAAELLVAMYDASLDQFASNDWSLNIHPNFSSFLPIFRAKGFGKKFANLNNAGWKQNYNSNLPQRKYRTFLWNARRGEITYGGSSRLRTMTMARSSLEEGALRNDESIASEFSLDAAPPPPAPEQFAGKNKGIVEEKPSPDAPQQGDKSPLQIRKNLNETVFFMPNLKTDEEGNIIIAFTMNEALTRWKFLGLAHTKELQTAIFNKEVVTKKDLMVQPNAPRFFRAGDALSWTAKVVNLSDKDLKGEAELLLFDTETLKSVDKAFQHKVKRIPYDVKAGQSAALAWDLKVPEQGIGAVTYRVIARSGEFSDGEENSLPVLTNRMLVTESMPINVKGGQEKTFTFERLQQANSTSLVNHRFELEFSSNPAWYGIQALPYLMEYPHECTEQIFNRFYANSMASFVANDNPAIRKVFDEWKNTDALASELNKNEALKALLLQETPWVLQAKSQEQQKQNIGLLFDINRMADEMTVALQTLTLRQENDGGFSWFPGGKSSVYITQYLVEGFGHLKALGVLEGAEEDQTRSLIIRATRFMDKKLVERYNQLKAGGKDDLDKGDFLGHSPIHYLYARSFFKDISIDRNTQKVVDFYLDQAAKNWVNKGIYEQGMIALAAHRFEKATISNEIIASLKEIAITKEELGTYWKLPRGWFWYQHPIETQALMVELFAEVAQDKAMVESLKLWLLKNKQTNHWKTTKATSAAVYALFQYGDNWLQSTAPVQIEMGTTAATTQVAAAQQNADAGTGYFSTAWEGDAVSKDFATIKVTNPNPNISWGAAYWQYFEDLDKITSFEDTPLKLKKELFVEVAGTEGLELKGVKNGAKPRPGDRLVVRIELEVDRAMEYIHMKDLRASGLEPVNTISTYKWQGGLGYYQSTGDAATNFFFDYLPAGKYVFEYPLYVVHEGDFSTGITTIQSMYAPEFSSHSQGERIKIGKK